MCSALLMGSVMRFDVLYVIDVFRDVVCFDVFCVVNGLR